MEGEFCSRHPIFLHTQYAAHGNVLEQIGESADFQLELKTMSIRKKLAIALIMFLVPMAYTSTASAQSGAGAACVGTQCGLGGQGRGQIGDGLPLPISIAPYLLGEFVDITIQTTNTVPTGLPVNGQGLGQHGQVKASPNATIMQTTAMLHAAKTGNPRNITIPPGVFHFQEPEGSIGVLGFNQAVFAVQTNLIYDGPHPGTTANGAPVTGPSIGGPRVYSAGGRAGLPTVSFCAGQPGTPGNNFLGNCTAPADGVGINGLARFTKTVNQFGGSTRTRVLGTAKVYFNKNGFNLADVPCAGVTCEFQISVVLPGTAAVGGGTFGLTVMNPAFTTPTGLYTGAVGFNGTIISVGNAVTTGGTAMNGIPFTGQAATSIGFPNTTGLLTISVTSVVGATPEIFARAGTDARTANGQGVIALVSGAMSARSISLGNGNPGWTTYEIPEPSAIFAASAGLFALFGCHQLVRRRSR
jgi:hypothetical protein